MPMMQPHYALADKFYAATNEKKLAKAKHTHGGAPENKFNGRIRVLARERQNCGVY